MGIIYFWAQKYRREWNKEKTVKFTGNGIELYKQKAALNKKSIHVMNEKL
ncbi:MAG: hypothetical protein J5507_01165 [Clostridia bacterium]|nr:hypothetical protein [Clostridia bacterium]